MAVFFAYCRIVATDIHFIACMRYRRGRPKGVPLWESRKMLFGENAIRRPPVAVRKTMPHGFVMYITMKKAVARGSWFVARKTMPHGPVVYITMKKAVARGSWFVARKTMPHGPVMYITIYSRRAALAGSAPTHKADGRVFCILQNCGNRHSFHRLYAIS